MKETSSKIEIPQVAFDWYDEYAHGDIDRRTFIRRLSTLGVAGLTATAISSALLPNYAQAEQVSFNDADIVARYVEIDAPNGHGKAKGYLVIPKNASKESPVPGVLVVHENRGLNPYIEDVARRLAKAGFAAFAPDALFPLGGYPGNDDEGREMQKSLDKQKILGDFKDAAVFLKQHELTKEKLGVVGFCFGGYVSNQLAASMPDTIDAAVPFYGTPPTEDLHKLKGPLLLHFAGLDERVNATWPDYQNALKTMGTPYESHIYDKVNHGFHNDSTARYDEASANLAWQRTLDFFKQHLS